VLRREVTRSAVSGKSLAWACTVVHGMDAGAIVPGRAHN
jgi:N-methylhydantoinase B/oxoprolinase/acetone carboxylase alpha subunit